MDVAVGPCVSDHVMGHDPAPKVSFPDSSRRQDSWGHAAFRKPRADVIAERAHLDHSKKERCMEHAEDTPRGGLRLGESRDGDACI